MPSGGELAKSKNQSDMTPLQRSVHDFLQGVVDLDPQGVFTRADCKFCNHPLRKQAEDVFISTNNKTKVIDFFNEKYKESPSEYPKMTTANIYNHLKRHFRNTVVSKRKEEFGDRIVGMLPKQLPLVQAMEFYAAVLQDEFLNLASDDDLDPIKKNDAMVKNAKMMLDLCQYHDNLNSDMEKIEMFMSQFQEIMTVQIKKQTNPEVREVLVEQLHAIESIDVFRKK